MDGEVLVGEGSVEEVGACCVVVVDGLVEIGGGVEEESCGEFVEDIFHWVVGVMVS